MNTRNFGGGGENLDSAKEKELKPYRGRRGLHQARSPGKKALAPGDFSSRTLKHLLLFGAGMTGRGQVAQLASESGYRLTLVDCRADLVELLRRAGKYTVRLHRVGGHRDVVVENYQTLHTGDVAGVADALAQADLVVTCVLPLNLPSVAPLLAAGIARRFSSPDAAPVNVIAAENMEHSSTVLKEMVMEHLSPEVRDTCLQRVGFPDSMIARVVPVSPNPLLIEAEEFSEWTTDGTVFLGENPQIHSLELVDNQEARLERKLFMHNAGHAVCGFWGLYRGYQYVHEAARDPLICREIDAAVLESGEAVRLQHGFSPEAIDAYRQNLLERLPGDLFVDGLDRVCREPLRKIGPNERLLGPIALCLHHGITPTHLCRAVAVAMRTHLPGDIQYQQMGDLLESGGPGKVLASICRLDPTNRAYRLILEQWTEI